VAAYATIAICEPLQNIFFFLIVLFSAVLLSMVKPHYFLFPNYLKRFLKSTIRATFKIMLNTFGCHLLLKSTQVQKTIKISIDRKHSTNRYFSNLLKFVDKTRKKADLPLMIKLPTKTFTIFEQSE